MKICGGKLPRGTNLTYFSIYQLTKRTGRMQEVHNISMKMCRGNLEEQIHRFSQCIHGPEELAEM